jgi:hypothetical protein
MEERQKIIDLLNSKDVEECKLGLELRKQHGCDGSQEMIKAWASAVIRIETHRSAAGEIEFGVEKIMRGISTNL